MVEAAGKQCYLQEHLTLITPVEILTQPFVFRCDLHVITGRRGGKGKELRNGNRKWSTCAVRTGKEGVGEGFSGFCPPINHMCKKRSQARDYL